jgi:hypothetical protein
MFKGRGGLLASNAAAGGGFVFLTFLGLSAGGSKEPADTFYEN